MNASNDVAAVDNIVCDYFLIREFYYTRLVLEEKGHFLRSTLAEVRHGVLQQEVGFRDGRRRLF